MNHQFTHMTNLKEPEAPLVRTGFEDPLSSFCSMNDVSDGYYKVVAKFEKNKYNFILIGYDENNKRYHAWKRTELEEHSEGFSTRYDNSFIDSLEIGDTICKGDMVVKSSSFDKNMTYRFGRNLNTVYMVSAKVLEDGILIMNNADKKMSEYRTNTVTISLADNEILVNLYGDNDHYQGIPNIGEKVNKGVLAAIRKLDNSKSVYALKMKRLRKAERGDRRVIVSGRVIDIEIRYNKERDKMVNVGANKMLLDIYDAQQDYYKKVSRYMQNIVDNADDGGYTYSDEFSEICEYAKLFIDSSVFFSDANDNVFGNMQITITLMSEEKLLVGSKMVGRTGNKGVISKILPPKESWFMEDGTPVEVVVATLGIVGRLNQAQMNEHSINELSATAVRMMKMTNDVDEKGDIMIRLMKHLNSDQAKDFKKWYKDLDEEDKAKWCRKVERDGIVIFQDPIDNVNMMDIGKAYEEFPPHWQRIMFPDGSMSIRKVLCAKMFYMRLKQDPIEKYSARSRGPVNPLNNLPSKSNNKKKFLEPYSDVPVRFGEQEQETLLAMVNHPAAIADYMMENSTSWQAKVVMGQDRYLGDIEDGFEGMSPEEIEDMLYADSDFDYYNNHDVDYALEKSGKKNAEVIAGLLTPLGVRIEFDVEEAPEGEYFNDTDY